MLIFIGGVERDLKTPHISSLLWFWYVCYCYYYFYLDLLSHHLPSSLYLSSPLLSFLFFFYINFGPAGPLGGWMDRSVCCCFFPCFFGSPSTCIFFFAFGFDGKEVGGLEW